MPFSEVDVSKKICREKGSHVKLKRELNGRELIVTIPKHKELKKGVLLNILRQAELTREEFLELL